LPPPALSGRWGVFAPTNFDCPRRKSPPEAIDIILIDHPELAPTGAGEASSRPTAGALANAIFDATGIRLRQAPFTPERLKAGLA
jgi:CO/xanthine dehydrogenase Mo-binding subunit